jgi:hypothetical protein
MKKILFFLFVLIFNHAYSATGNASDGEIVALSVLILIFFVVGTGYFIDFLKRKIKAVLSHKRFNKNKSGEEFSNSFLQNLSSVTEG